MWRGCNHLQMCAFAEIATCVQSPARIHVPLRTTRALLCGSDPSVAGPWSVSIDVGKAMLTRFRDGYTEAVAQHTRSFCS